jgi:hypothetical protein
VLPIRQTSRLSRPAGIDLPVPPIAPSPDAFHRPAPLFEPMVPIAVPALPQLAPDDAPAPPPAPRELAAPVAPALDPALWGLDIDPEPATGRRRGASDPEVDQRRKGPETTSLPARLLGRGKSGAARLLVLALVVGAEGVAVTSMGGHATAIHTSPVDANTASGAFEISSDPTGSTATSTASTLTQEPLVRQAFAQQQEAQQADVTAAAALDQAQAESSKAKVVAALAQAKAAADRVKAAADRRARAMRDSQRDPKAVAQLLVADRGWSSSQFSCLVSLWNRESGWRYTASNPGSGAYGIPQALPGSKMSSVASDWRTNPVTQIKWGLSYIADRYGTPCGAWGHSQATGWY